MARAAKRLIAATRRLFHAGHGETTDRVLLARFADSRDEAAFAELVERHGSLVLATCRRQLNDASTADDVFQATFLVLARKASSNGWQTSIGPWLHAVAVRLARKARSRRIVPTLDPSAASGYSAPICDPAAPLAWEEVKGALDDELAQLPATLSQPLVLCYLQGRTRDEAARSLRISLAMLKRRLERGRNLLRDRLSRRGITLAAAGWGIALTNPPLSAEAHSQAVRFGCASTRPGAISPAVADLLRDFHVAPVSRWLVVTAVVAMGLSLGALAYALRPATPPPTDPAPKQRGDATTPDTRTEAAKDPLPAGAVARFGSPRLIDFTIAKSASFSPDGKLFATSGQNSPLCVWDAVTGKLVRTHSNLGSVFDMRWRADGVLVAVTFFNHNVFLMQAFGNWKDLDTNDEPLAGEHRAIAASPPVDRMEQAFLSGDGKWAFAVMQSQDGKSRRVNRYSFAPNKSSATAKPDKSIPIAVSFGYGGVWVSHEGRTVLIHEIAVGDRPDRLLAFDLMSDKPENLAWSRVLPAGPAHRPEMCLSIDGKRVVILSEDDRVEVWDGPAGKRIRELPKAPKYYDDGNRESRGIDLTPDGKRVALVYRGSSNEVGGRVVEVETGKDVCTLAPQPLPRFGGVARFSADGKRVAQVAYGVARIWNAESGADAVPLPGHCGSVTSLVSTVDGKTVISAGSDLTVRAWDANRGKEAWKTTFAQTTTVRFVTPEGIVVQESLFGTNGPGSLLDLKTGKRRPLPGELASAVTKPMIAAMGVPAADALLAMSPDGQTMVTLALHSSVFRVWSWPAGKLRATVPIAPPEKFKVGHCLAAHFTPDGKQLVVVMHYERAEFLLDGGRRYEPIFIERWDPATGKMLDRANGGTTHAPPKLIPYANGVIVLGNSSKLRDAVTGATVMNLALPEGQADDFHWAGAAIISPDGRTLAIGDGWNNKVWLFETRTGKLRHILLPDGRYRNALQFLSDGRLVTASDTALVWSIGLQPTESTEDLATLWTALAEADPKVAWPAMSKLAGRGTSAIELIRTRVSVVPRIKEGTIERIVRALDAAGFNAREAASAELDRLGACAVAAVKAKLKTGVSEEARTRLERFLTRHDRTDLQPEELQSLRAIEVLEAIGTREARKFLDSLAAGEPGSRSTREAAGAASATRSALNIAQGLHECGSVDPPPFAGRVAPLRGTSPGRSCCDA